jgi:uncharacterized protein (TIGR02001 family)
MPMPRAHILTVSTFCLLLSGPALAAVPAGEVSATGPVEAMPPDAEADAPGASGEAKGSDVEGSQSATEATGDEASAAEDEADAAEPSPAEADGEEEGCLLGELCAEVGLVSDYIFRGITNTDHNPAIQGGLSYTVDVGLPYAQPYVAFWGSNVDFDDGGEASVELDLGFGLSGTIAGIEWDLGGLYYAYPGASSDLNYNYWEIPLKLTYPIGHRFSLVGQYAFAPDYFGNSGQAHYLLAGGRWEQPIGPTVLAVEATTGHQWIADNAAYGAEDYQDWRIGLSLTIDKVTLGIAYTDTTLGKGQCFGGTNMCEPRAVFSIGASF